ncbi:hypothetical protein AOQ84DRAFT_386723 [Glonium stellatum]|uniref:F-box domain-containing protein n=1 Tax=Glonium stellatum TaxID=574774 RepID=A0A8E2F7W8_9PEZI|nr:hypothetical protein AOQ84DRAFT_386723 [Glonium stellatum]
MDYEIQGTVYGNSMNSTDIPFLENKMIDPTSVSMKLRTLDDLPAELLLEILSYISSSRSAYNDNMLRPDPMIRERGKYVGNPANPNAELWSLCLTNRYLNYVSEPVLYQEFHHALWESPALIYFLRTIIRRPHLAGHVKRVSLDYLNLFKAFDTLWDRLAAPTTLLVDKDDIQLFLQTARQSLLMSRVNETRISKLEDSALVLLLFSQASNLRELHYNVSGNLLTQASTDLINTALWNMLVFDSKELEVFPFSSLKKVSLSYVNADEGSSHETGGFPLNRASAWLFLPSVESLELFRCTLGRFRPRSMLINSSGRTYDRLHVHRRLPSALSAASLTSITFRDSIVDPDALYDMLSNCKSLKSFDLEWSSRHVDYDRVGRALRTQKHSLETLRLNASKAIHDYCPAIEEIEYRVDSLGSLHDFKKLSFIDVPGLAITGWRIPLRLDETLPPNIQTLKIQSLGLSPLYQIGELGCVAPERFRSLRLIEVGVWELQLADYLMVNGVEFFAKQGVNLVITKLTDPSKYASGFNAGPLARLPPSLLKLMGI